MENAGHFPASLPQCKHSLWMKQALNETVNGTDGKEGSAVHSRGSARRQDSLSESTRDKLTLIDPSGLLGDQDRAAS